MATTPPVPPMPGAGAPMGVPPAKKSNALVWILGGLGGCLTLVIICVLGAYFFIAHKAKQAGIDGDLLKRNPGLAAAKIMVAANPNVEMVSADEGRQEITVRDKQNGKTYSVSFEDAKNGKLTFKEDGKTTMTVGGKAKVPSWVPDYPGSDPQGAFTATGADGDSGTFTFKTKDPSDKVVQYYQDQFKSSGMKVTTNLTTQDGKSSAGMLTAQDDSSKHTVNVVLGFESGETTVGVTYATSR
jgi:hypothetical protein